MKDDLTPLSESKQREFSAELALYGLAFVLALCVRLFRLGVAPLSNFESGWALQALDLTRSAGDVTVSVGSQPAYVMLTSLLFRVLDSSNGLARLFPALAGALVIWLPLVFLLGLKQRRELGLKLRLAGIIMAFGLAFDPGLTAVSRLAGGPMPAVSFGLLGLALAYAGLPALAGISTGLALLSGTAILPGIIGIALAWGAVNALSPSGLLPSLGPAIPSAAEADRGGFSKRLLFFGGGVILLLGTLFLAVPQGLGGFASILPDYLRGWATISGVPVLRLPATLLLYQALAVVFGLVGLVRGWWLARQDDPQSDGYRLAQRLSLWMVIAIILAMVYTNRQVSDLAWAIVPLWALAAIELAEHFPLEKRFAFWPVSLGLAALILILSVLIWFNVLRLGMFQPKGLLYGSVIAGAAAMGGVVVTLVAMGWSVRAARYGLVWGVCVALSVPLLAGMWSVSQTHPNGAEELWTIAPQTRQDDLLLETLTDLSEWQTGQNTSLALASLWDTPSLRWALRDFSQARFVADLAPDDNPPVIFTVMTDQESADLARAVGYQGQDFAWQEYPDWTGALPPNVVRWLAFREAPTAHETLILWVRHDLFPGGESSARTGGQIIP